LLLVVLLSGAGAGYWQWSKMEQTVAVKESTVLIKPDAKSALGATVKAE
jgi:hypothetical protein